VIESFRSGDRQLFILIGGGRAAHAYPTHNLTVHENRNASDQRSEIFQSRHHGAAFAAGVDEFFENARGLLEHDGGLGFADGNVCPG
jgi:hypothetical protein